jgi:hypothetical protein
MQMQMLFFLKIKMQTIETLKTEKQKKGGEREKQSSSSSSVSS